MVIVYSASDYIEGNLVRGLLESQGIETYVNGEYLQGGIGELMPMGHIKLSVDDEDESVARRVIERYERGEYRIEDETSLPREIMHEHTVDKNDATSFNQFKTLALGVIIGIALMVLIYMMAGQSYGYDNNGDGAADNSYVYKGERIVGHESDRNFDGKMDLWIKYDMSEIVASHKADNNFDGKVDSWGRYRDGSIYSEKYDTDGDGRIDMRAYFDNGQVSRIKMYDLNNGRKVKIQYFNHFKIVKEEVDSNRDGRIDKVRYMDPYEEPFMVEDK